MTPRRIQLRRTKGWRMPPNTVSVARPTRHGNPYLVHPRCWPVRCGPRCCHYAAEAVTRFHLGILEADPTLPSVETIRAELAGKNLACWCRLCDDHADGRPLGINCRVCQPCHVDVLLRVAALVVDLFAGPGGWDVAARALGLDPLGIELDEDACATRAAAGLRTIRADVATYPLDHLGPVDGLIASPPCQDWSRAGHGRRFGGSSGGLVTEVMRWAEALRPRWIACEQVDTVEILWREYAARLREMGYYAWSGLLDAADYGTPQNRVRAVLMAHRDRPVSPPLPTHTEHPQVQLDGSVLEPWVTMADALGWDRVLDTRRDQQPDGTTQTRVSTRPGPTVTGKTVGQWLLVTHQNTGPKGARVRYERRDDAIPVTLEDCLVLQGMPADYPIQGRTKHSRSAQVGNLVPPPLAAAVLRELL